MGVPLGFITGAHNDCGKKLHRLWKKITYPETLKDK
jgi:hypothetical protein